MKYKIGLVLSGGALKGIAHIGVIKAMQELGIEADVVAGTSAGAIVGSMYAVGLSIDQMKAVFQDVSMFDLSTYTWKKPGIINPLKFFDDVEGVLGSSTFEELKKPLYVVATDILRAESVVFSEGPLKEPIMGSAAFPGVFAPVEYNGTLYADGGILNNFPTETIRSKCEEIIGVHVQAIDHIEKESMKSTFKVLQRIYSIATRYESASKYKDCDVMIAPQELEKFFAFDMRNREEMFEIGYRVGKQALEAYLKGKSIES